MKIIQEGKIPEPPKLWYNESSWHCPNCHCIFETDENDDVKTSGNSYFERSVIFNCPTCNKEIIRNEPPKVRSISEEFGKRITIDQ